MFLQNKQNGILVEVLDTQSLIDPLQSEIHIRVQAGQEEQDPEPIKKEDLIFPSGERLPQCWMDVNYRSQN
jgi:hypothetical protein